MMNNSLYRNILTSLLLMVISLTVHADKVELNPPFGDAIYNPFSVFSPDASSPSDYKDQVVVVFHGFMSATPNGTYKRIRKKLLKTHTALGINYDPLDFDGTVKFLQEVKQSHLDGRRVIVAGTSLGGFWARYFGDLIGAEKVIIINPVVRPAEQLAKNAGKIRKNVRRDREYSVTQEAIDSYRSIDVVPMTRQPTLLIVAKDDDLMPNHVALEAYGSQSNIAIQVYDQGGHAINLKKHEALQRIVDFVYKD